jgi:hypothetical protein
MRLFKFAARLFVAFFALVLGLSLASALAALVMRPRLSGVADPGDDELDLGTVYGSLEFRSEATAFRGGRVICWYSGMDLDLRGAALDPVGADLVVWTLYGGTRIRVPEAWRVDSHGIAVFGGAGSTATPPDGGSDGPALHVRHRTLFGGFGVIAEADDELLAV